MIDIVKGFLVGVVVGVLIMAFWPHPEGDLDEVDRYERERDSLRRQISMIDSAYSDSIAKIRRQGNSQDSVKITYISSRDEKIERVNNIDDVDSLREIIRAELHVRGIEGDSENSN